MALADVGYAHALLGNFPQALSYCEQAPAGDAGAGSRGCAAIHLGHPRLHPSPVGRSPASDRLLSAGG
jgi:hypothetical protein